MVAELEAKLASDSGIDSTGLSYITMLTAEELTRVGNRFIASMCRNSGNYHSPSFFGSTPTICDENSEFVCFAPVLSYLSPAQEEAYTAIVRRAAELGMLAVVRKEWNPALESILPSKYND